MAKATGHHKPKKAGKRKVKHIRVEHAGNGFTVHHGMEPEKKMTRGSMMEHYEPDQQNVFNDKNAMLAHVGQLAGQMGGGDDEAAEGEAVGAPGGAPPPMQAA